MPTIVHRHATLGDSIKYWVRPDIENRIKEGTVGVRFESQVLEITPSLVIIEGPGGVREEVPAEAVFLLTGYLPDVALMRAAGVNCDAETLSPEHSSETFETNVPNLFVIGGAMAGRHTGTVFIENGRFHGEKAIATLAERLRD
jgi:thioredoxin reductase (NADPH)